MNAQKNGKEVGIATKFALPEIAHMLVQNECCETINLAAHIKRKTCDIFGHQV
jgi:hypothetical protein